MSLVAILADIHGNLEALEAVLAAVRHDGADYHVHLGDLVGYNANPRECLHLVQKRRCITVLGNHDLALLEPAMAAGFNVLAHQALLYSRQQLTDSDLHYLQHLPQVEVLWDKYLICHASPENLLTYIMNVFQARRVFNLLHRRFSGLRIGFHGHTHVQRLWIHDPRGKVVALNPPAQPFKLEPENSYLINPGSVGQPRQQDNRASYLLFDSTQEMIHFKAVPYDIPKAQRKILQAQLPEYLAHRLQDGI